MNYNSDNPICCAFLWETDADGIYTAQCSECVVTNKMAMSLIFMPSKYWNFPYVSAQDEVILKGLPTFGHFSL